MLDTSITASFGALVALAGAAAADPDHASAGSDRWSVTALLGTDVGLDLAAGLQIEAPVGLRLTATAGWLPGGYAWGLKQYYVHVYDGRAGVGDLLEHTVRNAFVARGNLGLRPFATRGFFVSGGYTLVVSDKSGLIASELEAAAQERFGVGDRGIARTFDSDIRVHLLDAQLGWQWGLGAGWSLRASIGAMVIVHTTTSLEPNFTPRNPALVASITQTAERRLEDAGTGIWAPLLSVYLGYTF